MSLQVSEKKAVSPRLVAALVGVTGALTAACVWLIVRAPGEGAPAAGAASTAPASTAPASTAPASTAPASTAPASEVSAAQAEARRARLKAATMELPRGPLLPPLKTEGPVEQSRGGTAARAGRLIRLDVDRAVLGDAQLVCLDAPESDLKGVQATCKPLDGWPGRAMCARADAAAATELTGPITWRLPCP